VKRARSGLVFDILNVTLFCVIGVVMLFPFWNIIASSFVGAKEYYSRPFIVIPTNPTLSAYRYIFSTRWISNSFLISTLVTILGTAYNMLLVVTAAYALTKKGLPGRGFFTFYFLFTMYFSGGLVPYYLVVSKFLHLYDSLAAIIITNGIYVWNLLVLRTFFREIPPSMSESAIIDGANELQILVRIILPLSLPALATLTLFTAVGHWNEWARALYFINDENKLPLQNVLQRMLRDTSRETGNAAARGDMDKAYQNLMGGAAAPFDVAIKLATVTVTTLPILCVYPFLQRYFVKGVMIGAVKG
jgi:putative aldouronate transport system permease protein